MNPLCFCVFSLVWFWVCSFCVFNSSAKPATKTFSIKTTKWTNNGLFSSPSRWTCNFLFRAAPMIYPTILIFDSVSVQNNWRMFLFLWFDHGGFFLSLPCSMFNPYHFTHKWFFQQINTKCRKTSNPKMFFSSLFCSFCSAFLLPSDFDSLSMSDFHSLFRYVCISMATTDIFYCSNFLFSLNTTHCSVGVCFHLYRDIGFMMILLCYYWWCCLFPFRIFDFEIRGWQFIIVKRRFCKQKSQTWNTGKMNGSFKSNCVIDMINKIQFNINFRCRRFQNVV